MSATSNLNPIDEKKDIKRLSVRSNAANANQDNEEDNPSGMKKMLTRLNTKNSNQKRASTLSIQNPSSQN